MIKILVASAEVKNNQDFCQFLTNDKKFLIYNTFTVNDTLDIYTTIQPDILIFGTSLGVSNCIDIINRISILFDVSHKCYTFLVATDYEAYEIIKNINNFSKLYKILYKPFNITKTLLAINEIAPIIGMEDLTFNDIMPFFLLLNLSVSSKGAEYLMASIIDCYYIPFLSKNLETRVYKDVAKYFNTAEDKVRANIANTLLTLDTEYIKDTKNPLLKLFNFRYNATPKRFIEILSMYFRHKKNK